MQFPTRWGEEVKSAPCDSRNEYQKFVKGVCIEVDPAVYPASKYDRCRGCVGSEEGFPSHSFETPRYLSNSSQNRPHEVYCQLRSILPGSSFTGDHFEDDFMCLDIRGQSTRMGSSIIGYSCIGSWNQYFRMTSDCRISATQPKALSLIRKNVNKIDSIENLCIEVIKESNNSAFGEVRTSQCSCIRDKEKDKFRETQEFKYLHTNQLEHGYGFFQGRFMQQSSTENLAIEIDGGDKVPESIKDKIRQTIQIDKSSI